LAGNGERGPNLTAIFHPPVFPHGLLEFCTDPKKSRTFALLLQFEIEAFCNLPPLAPLVDRKGFNRFLMNHFHVLMEIVIAA
jgi:hypothetical protein